MALPISTSAKGVLWVVLFGLAKTAQYGGLTILGVEGYKKLRDKFRREKVEDGAVEAAEKGEPN